MNKFESRRLQLKIVFGFVAVLLPILSPFLAPLVGIQEGGKISVNGIQVVYAVLAVELALAVYVWGVGNWSRFEPPRSSSDKAPTPSGAAGPGQGGNSANTGVSTPNPGTLVSSPQSPSTAPQGGR